MLWTCLGKQQHFYISFPLSSKETLGLTTTKNILSVLTNAYHLRKFTEFINERGITGYISRASKEPFLTSVSLGNGGGVEMETQK